MAAFKQFVFSLFLVIKILSYLLYVAISMSLHKIQLCPVLLLYTMIITDNQTLFPTGLSQKYIRSKILKTYLRILRFFQPTTICNEFLWKSTNQQTIINEIRRKWKQIGQPLRKPHNHITRTSLDWNLWGSRRRSIQLNP